MCGIAGYVGDRESADVLVDALSKLEYRGYDSAGIAVFDHGNIKVKKCKGRLANLVEKMDEEGKPQGHVGIGHTRWATHGEPSDINSHPHGNKRVTIVHNGIIENYKKLKDFLVGEGYSFASETDTEVAAKLLDYYYDGDPMKTIAKVLSEIKGSYALGIMFRDFPDEIFAVRKDSPLIVGVGEHENFIASDVPAILKYTRNVYYIGNMEIAKLGDGKAVFYNLDGDEIEKELGIATCPINWPIGSGKKFRGVYDRDTEKILTFSDTQKGTKEGVIEEIPLSDSRADEIMDPEQKAQLLDEIELLDGASADFDQELVSKGKLTPVFFGSALTNFGVETFLEHFLKMTTSPLPRVSDIGEIDPMDDDFSAFVFKIQANMNKAHRDRLAFMRICSGKFERGMEAYHVQEGKNIKLATGTQLMAQDRAIVDEAYAGDIIGLFDPGIFSIGDTLCTGKKKVEFAGIPTFSPEHFARIEQKDTMKRKQFVKGMEQIAQEGAIQIFREVGGGMEEVVVGVVGVLQLEVLEYRLNTEYNVEIRMQQLPFEQLRWIQNDPDTYVLRDLDLTSDTKAVEDMKGNRLLLFTSDWAIRWAETHNETLKLSEFGNI